MGSRMADGDDHDVKRGASEDNPLQRSPLVLWRGAAEGIPEHPHSESRPHDFGPGLYLTLSLNLAEEYARLRATPENRPIILRARVPVSVLGPPESILNLAEGPVGAQWEAFLGGTVGSYTRRQIIEMDPETGYWSVFSEFLETTGRKLEDYKVVIGYEYLRKEGKQKQVCVSDPALQKEIRGRLQEFQNNPLWIRVVDTKGEPMDVNVNDPEFGEQNLAYVQFQRREMEKRVEMAEPTPTTGNPRPPTFSPGVRGQAGFMAFLEIARYVLEIAAIEKSLPSDFEQKLEPVRKKWLFWRDYGIRATILALVTEGKTRIANANDDRPTAAAGRVLRALIPQDWKKVHADEFELFIAFVDNFATPGPNTNALDGSLQDLRAMIAFLSRGWKVDAVRPAEKKGAIIKKRSWFVHVQGPETEGSTKLTDDYYSLDGVLANIRKRVMERETQRIRKMTTVYPAASSRLRSRRDDVCGGFQLDRSRILRYRDKHEKSFYSTMYRDGSVGRLGDVDDWFDHDPGFFRVGPVDIGTPFWVGKGLLVTGADADTNALLYSILQEKDCDALVAEYEPTLSVGSLGKPQSYVNAPLVYVDQDDVT